MPERLPGLSDQDADLCVVKFSRGSIVLQFEDDLSLGFSFATGEGNVSLIPVSPQNIREL